MNDTTNIPQSVPADSSRASAATTTAHIAESAYTAVDVAVENLEKAELALRNAQTAAGIEVNDAAAQAQLYSQEAISKVKDYVNEHPVRSVGIALATGYLFATLTKK